MSCAPHSVPIAGTFRRKMAMTSGLTLKVTIASRWTLHSQCRKSPIFIEPIYSFGQWRTSGEA
jgi:hypothetical protein